MHVTHGKLVQNNMHQPLELIHYQLRRCVDSTKNGPNDKNVLQKQLFFLYEPVSGIGVLLGNNKTKN